MVVCFFYICYYKDIGVNGNVRGSVFYCVGIKFGFGILYCFVVLL